MKDKGKLYKRWRKTLDTFNSSTALIDLRSDEELTFSELNSLLQKKPSAEVPLVSNSQGVDFIIEVLRAWRDGVPFIPLEYSSKTAKETFAGIPPYAAHVKHTSGTTGDPRLVLFTENQLEADADQIAESMQLNQYNWNIGLISIAHSYGFSNLILPLLLHGIPLIICSSPLPESLKHALSIVDGQESAILPGVPAMWSAWHKSGVLINAPVGLAISAGAPLPIELEYEIFNSSAIKVHNFYGSSECGAIAYDHSTTIRKSSGIVGTPIAGVEINIREDGRLMVASDAVGMRYWPEMRSEELGSGRFITPDIAEIDRANGQVKIIGRDSEIINVAGRKLSPLSVESALLEMDGIASCVAFGIPSRNIERVEDVVACYSACHEIPDREIFQHLHEKLNAWQLPKILWNCNDLEINQLEKIPRAYWRQQYLERSSTDDH